MLARGLRFGQWRQKFAFLDAWKGMDRWLLFIPIALTLLGGLLIRSTQANQNFADWWQHWITGAVGVGLALAIARWRYDNWLKLQWWLYGVTCLSLIAVRFVGTTALGAERWISIGGFNIQPSEFAKPLMIVVLAAILSRETADRLPGLIKAIAIMSVPWLLIFLQPNLGTSLIFGAIVFGMLYWANAKPGWLLLMLSPLPSAILFEALPWAWPVWLAIVTSVGWKSFAWRWRGAIGALLTNVASGVVAGWAWQNLLQDYQKDRLILFLDPNKDPLGGGYNLIQARIAIGAGGIWGQGLNQGTQTQLRFIPEQHTDFIFSAVGEELGFVGSIAVILLFWLVCWRLIAIATSARDNFGSLLAIGVLSMLVFQIVINIAMTIGLGPVTGIPLPWLSYGRSALLANFIAIGIVESVWRFRQISRY
ncbi:rod shape-determining protein RodA [Synechococcus elongatus]|uniref:Peptidoglycan glycosyltransferase RodA n=1 Tax=Synechococcus elongatus (strain ATCC 33912 / PCC 7942 / FACHB-805) TaxID=1140 RepID=Q31P85_SYNE7|nr:rod shape-determining protein RodA [Synechococcus elongatus]ABB57134.1 cell division protein FtsW [Synechococcus elongatus PCC 7942 = FACHB-805]AJD58350.1 cell division protein FtsW [Synechococcus elongatus UTEX 2973]MBD2587535.1 rod shape-determining protein RodA [Synechococcus elongatus FACHB-242]MBD2688686.1 rod shape-determining protein RodA [Synechococcus elongatus FACHB-1061]MBD2707757.1 rod shape-determining protein RodA [Synechococcus elongatus PCC 7942 = FACHB-805]